MRCSGTPRGGSRVTQSTGRAAAAAARGGPHCRGTLARLAFARSDAALAAWMPKPLGRSENELRALLHVGFAQSVLVLAGDGSHSQYQTWVFCPEQPPTYGTRGPGNWNLSRPHPHLV